MNTIYHLSKDRPSARGDYSYVSRGLGPKAPTLTGFMVLFYQVLSVAGVPEYVGRVFLPGLHTLSYECLSHAAVPRGSESSPAYTAACRVTVIATGLFWWVLYESVWPISLSAVQWIVFGAPVLWYIVKRAPHLTALQGRRLGLVDEMDDEV